MITRLSTSPNTSCVTVFAVGEKTKVAIVRTTEIRASIRAIVHDHFFPFRKPHAVNIETSPIEKNTPDIATRATYSSWGAFA